MQQNEVATSFAASPISDGFIVLCGMGVGVIAILGTLLLLYSFVAAHYRRRMQLDDMEATLKMEMIQRGMTPEDIERVLSARMGKSDQQELVELVRASRAHPAQGWSQPARQS